MKHISTGFPDPVIFFFFFLPCDPSGAPNGLSQCGNKMVCLVPVGRERNSGH